MSKDKTKIKIPILNNESSKLESIVTGFHNSLNVAKEIILERITDTGKKINNVDDIKIPDNSKELHELKDKVAILSNLFIKLDSVKVDITKHVNKNTEETFKNNFNEVVKLLDDSISNYFSATHELFDKFSNIEHNNDTEFKHLQTLIKTQPHDPLDYLFITENFTNLIEDMNEVKKTINQFITEYITNKYNNPYICEVIYNKELPIAEFTNFSKAVVYKDGLFKNKISFYKNDGKRWIRVC